MKQKQQIRTQKIKYFHKIHAAGVFVSSCSWKILLEFVYKLC